MWLVTSPLSWLLVATVVWAATRHRALRGLAALMFVLSTWLMTPWGANLLVLAVEYAGLKVPACSAGETAPVLLLMGGLGFSAASPDDVAVLSAESFERVVAARRVATARIIISGGMGGTVTEAEVGARLLAMLGVDVGRLQLDKLSLSTWDSAWRFAASQAQEAKPRVQLLTSSLHVPRAALALRRQGVQACQLALRSTFVPMSGVGYFIPQASALLKAQRAVHEGAGLLAYRLRRAEPQFVSKEAP